MRGDKTLQGRLSPLAQLEKSQRACSGNPSRAPKKPQSVSYPEVVFPDGSLGHIHAASLRPQVLVEGLIQDEAVYQAAAHKQVGILPVNVKRDILPLRVRQVHILERHHVLGALHHVNQVQSVGPTVGHDLKLPLAIGALEAYQGAPRGAVLPDAGDKHKALVVLDLPQDLFEYGGAHWGQVVEADEAVSREVRVLAPELFGPQSLS